MVVSTWLFKILASYCNSKLASAINCLALWLLCGYGVPDKTGSLTTNWQCRGRQGYGTVTECLPAALLIHFLLSASIVLSVSRALLSVPRPVHELLLNPSPWALLHSCPAVSGTWMSPVPINWETGRQIPQPKRWLAMLEDLDRLPLVRPGELALCAASWWSWSQGGQWGWSQCIS